MFNNVYFSELVQKSGLTHDYISYKLKLSEKTYSEKLANIKPFYTSEMSIIKDMFYLTSEEATNLFFANK